MALILPRNYHKISAIERNHISWIEPKLAERQDIRPLRIGILNIMPLGKQYEFNLLHPLGLSPLQIEPIWIRLSSHQYKTWDISQGKYRSSIRNFPLHLSLDSGTRAMNQSKCELFSQLKRCNSHDKKGTVD